MNVTGSCIQAIGWVDVKAEYAKFGGPFRQLPTYCWRGNSL